MNLSSKSLYLNDDLQLFGSFVVSGEYVLKKTNGASGILANMRETNGVSGAEIVLKRTNGSTGDIINTSGS